MDKIIFFHMNQLGDLLFSLPALSAARKQWPDKKIYCLVRPQYMILLGATGFVDKMIPRDSDSVFLTASRLHKEGIVRGIFFSESPESLITGFMGNIKERIGFSTASLSFLLTSKAERAGVPSLENNRRLGEKAGLENIPKDYCGLVKIYDDDLRRTDAWLSKNNIDPQKLVVLGTGASRKRQSKFWPEENWKIILDRLVKKGLAPVVAGAPAEKEQLEELASGPNGVKVFAPDNGIMELAALISKAKLFIGIDSGAMHLAASLGTKVVALFGPTDPAQVGPMPLEHNIVIKKDEMLLISPEEVWEKISEVLY